MSISRKPEEKLREEIRRTEKRSGHLFTRKSPRIKKAKRKNQRRTFFGKSKSRFVEIVAFSNRTIFSPGFSRFISATEILQEYTKKFEERTNFIGKIPRFPINLDDLKKMFPIDTINLPESAVQINDDDDDDDHLPPTAKEIMRRKVDLDDEHDELEDRNINAATSQPYLFPL